jgi:hypothetical protein
MGFLLYRMLRAGMPGTWTSSERVVALIVADACNDETRDGWISNARLCEETGLTPEGLSKVLKRLAGRGYEMRVVHGYGKDGRPVFAARGHTTDYRVPLLLPRPENPCDSTAFSSSAAGRKAVRQGAKGRATGRKGRAVVRPPPLDTPTEPLNTPLLLTEPSVEGNGAGEVNDFDYFTREGTDEARQAMHDELAEWIREHPA